MYRKRSPKMQGSGPEEKEYLGFGSESEFAAIKNNTHYSPQSFSQLLFAFALRNRFDSLLEEKVGKSYCKFFEARNGIYYILMYLKQKFHCERILVPDGICMAVKLASKRADYRMVYYRGSAVGARRNDVVLLTDSSIRLPSGTFAIQDNARNPITPSKRYDFTLYSFGNGKPLSSAGGGVVVVNNERLRDFLDVGKSLSRPSARVEMNAYLKTLFWRLTTSERVRTYGKRALRIADKEEEQKSGIKITNLNLSISSISEKLASTIL